MKQSKEDIEKQMFSLQDSIFNKSFLGGLFIIIATTMIMGWFKCDAKAFILGWGIGDIFCAIIYKYRWYKLKKELNKKESQQ